MVFSYAGMRHTGIKKNPKSMPARCIHASTMPAYMHHLLDCLLARSKTIDNFKAKTIGNFKAKTFGILAVSFFAVESSCVLYSVFLGVADAVVDAVVDAASAATRR